MTQIEQQFEAILNSKLEEIPKDIKTNREGNLVADEEDAENNRPDTFNTVNKFLRRKHASNKEINKDKDPNIRTIASSLQNCMN